MSYFDPNKVTEIAVFTTGTQSLGSIVGLSALSFVHMVDSHESSSIKGLGVSDGPKINVAISTNL